ncbi:unnamed protein product [Urochloa decumbens]|uniref:KIB1-4 beta-propeller domain-containing protein n=1 Tax=Urochloa decumbens TaxID=240449 RepID=A0ABC9F7M3_9POAL
MHCAVDRLDAFSVLRFPAVCKSWAAAFRGTPRRLRSGAPTLLTSCALHGDKEASTTFALHDMSCRRSFHAEADALKNRTWVGGKDDWLVTTDSKCNTELLNPATGGATLCVAPGPLYVFQQVALCRTPAHRDGYLAIALFRPCFLAFAAAGDERWTALKNPAGRFVYEDTIAIEGKIFAVDSFNLAPSISGQLLLVCMHVERRVIARVNRIGGGKKMKQFHAELPSSHGARCISLHELDAGSGAWRRVDDLGGDGDRALFVGWSYPFYAAVAPLRECYLKANNVYAADLSDHAAVVFDVQQGCADSCGSRLPRNSIASSRKPIWFRPATHLEGQASACT